MGPDWFVLVGVAVIVIGFLLKIDAIAVVIIAAMTTALIADVSFGGFLEQIGKAFVDNRSVSLFILTLPMIALSERYGLKEQAVKLIQRLHNITAPRFLTLYTVIRQFCGIFGIRISGMVQFVRPIVHPMTEAAAREESLVSSETDEETIKAQSAVAENTGNFFGQMGFVASSGVLLIVGTLDSLGYTVSPDEIAGASLPIIAIALVVAAINFQIVGRRLRRRSGHAGPVTSGADSE